MSSFVITDIGSTTTKALWIAEREGRYRLCGRAEAPTTVEAPHEDVTIGVREALRRLGEVSGRVFTSADDLVQSDVQYYSSSSAGGGLQVLVIGLFSKVTAVSAQKAALGAGAILLDVISNDDKRSLYERIEIIRQARPDMILLTGGLDGGDLNFVVEFADVINSANPRPRFGETLKLPVIYAGNEEAQHLIKDTLGSNFDLHITDNIRPKMDEENLQPARHELHELFLSHVMQQAPGYHLVSAAVAAPIMPTPLAFGHIISELSKQEGVNIIAMDIGGATTDMFSVLDGEFNRTVSANLGMSYSIANVMQQCGLANIKRWLPFDIADDVLEDIIGNKMLAPTGLPANNAILIIEQAVAREALRLSLEHHRDLIRELPKKKSSPLAKLFSDSDRNWDKTASLIDTNNIGLIIGSGGVLSHAPRRQQAALMLLDACRPQGVTRLAVDSVFMMPHLGVLAQKHQDIALQVLRDDCFIPLGTVISGSGCIDIDQMAISIFGEVAGQEVEFAVAAGSIRQIDFPIDASGKLTATPADRIDIGLGPGQSMTFDFQSGVVGLMVDMRFTCEQSLDSMLAEWLIAIGAYTREEIEEARGQIDELS